MRVVAGMTQDDLAECVGTRKATISNWENGKTEPQFEDQEKCAGCLGVSVETLYSEKMDDFWAGYRLGIGAMRRKLDKLIATADAERLPDLEEEPGGPKLSEDEDG